MKQLLIILLIVFTISIKGQTDYLKYPDYETVVNRFFNNYSVIDIPGTGHIKFEKRPTGWHVVVVDYFENQQVIKNELFWHRKKKEFMEIDFTKSKIEGKNQELIDQYINQWSKRYYRICPYYGYPGWDWDVIQDFRNASDLPDSTLYALGRAYSSFASNLLNNNSGLADSKYQFELPQGRNCLSEKQLEKYRCYRHSAIEIFEQVARRNPKFETIVGAIGIKASNEHLTSFLDMRMYQNEQEANRELTGGLYTDFFISQAKNYLNSCAPNAILFTNGDNDTYPLLYIQSQYGFRTDVLVVNMSLLNTDRYINSLREPLLDAQGLPISLTPEEISGNKREVVLVEKRMNNPLPVNDLMEFIKNDEHTKSYGNRAYYFIPTNKFMLKKGEDTIEWEIDKPYFIRSHLILLDMLSANNWERPVYFAISLGDELFFGLTDYLQLEGMAYRLTSTKIQNNDGQIGFVNSTILYNNLLNKFDWSSSKKAAGQEKLFSKNYRIVFHRLANAFLNENKMDSATIVLDRCIEIFPNEVMYYDFVMLSIIEDYYKLGEYEKGNEIARQLAYNLKNNIGLNKDISLYNLNDTKDIVITKLKELVVEYGQEEVIGEIEL